MLIPFAILSYLGLLLVAKDHTINYIIIWIFDMSSPRIQSTNLGLLQLNQSGAGGTRRYPGSSTCAVSQGFAQFDFILHSARTRRLSWLLFFQSIHHARDRCPHFASRLSPRCICADVFAHSLCSHLRIRQLYRPKEWVASASSKAIRANVLYVL